MTDIKDLKNVKKVTVDGEEYTLQKLPVRQALELREQWQTDGMVDEVKMFDLVLEHFVVNPKKTLDDFEDVVVVEELVGEALKYQYRTKGK
ncbi:hypothetical protein [Sporanaerobacter acetigenes]|uniref:hypothetical protein n=1 Tax=Sporanaerobacter acetigenes TaxID=165813 RepID=UPI00104A0743|nr:hypothetical protein [Sporanaerobacter acetigenes]